MVADGQYAWLGGLNVGDEYMGESPEFGNWRDTHVRVDGPAVVAAQLSFAEDWHWATDETLQGLNWDPQAVESSATSALIIASGPADRLETASLMFTQAISSASSRVWIATPYFVPDDATVNALQLAVLRGLDVRVIIPDKNDNMLVQLAAWYYLEEIGLAGVRLYRYTNGFMHQKVMLVDDTVSMIGTANFDNHSFRLNFEITALIGGAEFAAQVENMLKEDMARSIPMNYEDYDAKPWWFKLAVRTARLTAPVL